MSRRGPLLAVLAAGLGLALGGCGADEETTTSSNASTASQASTAATTQGTASTPAAAGGVEAELAPEAQVDLAIKGVLASAAPDLACRRYATLSYVKQTFGSRSGCVQSTVPASAAESVKVTKIEISGDKATAKAVPTGGPSGGETIEVKLVRQGGIWKVDSLRSNAPVGP
jgi:hypothetical protein